MSGKRPAKGPSLSEYEILPPDQILKAIERQKNVISRVSLRAHKSNDTIQKKLAEARRRMLRQIELEIARDDIRDPTLFISYSSFSGHEFAVIAKTIAAEYGFRVLTGFDKEVEQGKRVAETIIRQILTTDSFLGIWTDDFEAESISRVDGRGNRFENLAGTIPSIWMPFELGVAAAQRKHLKLLILKGTHKYYFERPLHQNAHITFSPVEFEGKARIAIEALAGWVEDSRQKRR